MTSSPEAIARDAKSPRPAFRIRLGATCTLAKLRPTILEQSAAFRSAAGTSRKRSTRRPIEQLSLSSAMAAVVRIARGRVCIARESGRCFRTRRHELSRAQNGWRMKICLDGRRRCKSRHTFLETRVSRIGTLSHVLVAVARRLDAALESPFFTLSTTGTVCRKWPTFLSHSI